MRLPGFTPSIEPAIRDRIERELVRVETEFAVRILFAVESGSRAWGFPSPDSDYDVRFVYVHATRWYLSLTPGRDVIELPIEGDLDINGWDLRKALNLLLKPNPVLLEWLSSPVRYLWDEAIAPKLVELAERIAPASACLNHYLHLGEQQLDAYVRGREEINYKKYFYVLRPALAIRWIRLNDGKAPPMNIQEMSRGLDLDTETVTRIQGLLAIKARSREIGMGPRIALLDQLVDSEFAWARAAGRKVVSLDRRGDADKLFRDILAEVGP